MAGKGRKTGIELSEEQKSELRDALKTAKDNRSFRALTGVLLRSGGQSAGSVSNTLGASRKQVFEWCKKYRKKGIKGLFFRKSPGRPAIEGNKAKKRIPELLREDPQMFGFLKGRWVVRDISKALKKEGIRLSFQSVDRILLDLGINIKRPKLRAPGSIKKDYRKRREIRNYKKAAHVLEKKGLY